MKSCNLMYDSLSGRILLVVIAILYTFCVGSANAASEPGTVTIVLNSEPISLDPGENTKTPEGQILMENIVETLTYRNPVDSSITPKLATSWKQIDQNTWHFSLRKGVKFHDGADFNAEAVIFSIKRLYEKQIPQMTRIKFFSALKIEGKVLDRYTLEIKTEKPLPLLPTLIGLVSICSPNMPLVVSRHPIGTGPYKFVKWDADTQIIVERFDGYWGKQPQVKKAIYVWRKESAVRAAMALIGEADLAPEITLQDANRPDMDYSYFNSETTSVRIGGTWEPPLNDRRVRMALYYAVDRNAIRGTILSKDVVLASQMVVPGTFGYNPDLKPWPYDPQKAKQLLDEARKDGVPVDREIMLMGRTGQYPRCEELMETVMTMWKAVGLNMKIKMLEAGVFRTYDNKPFPPGPWLSQRQHDNNKGDAQFTAFHLYHCQGIGSPVCDKMVDDLIEKAQVSTGEERKNAWQALFKRVHEEIIPEVMLYHMVAYARVGKRINFKPSIATNGEIQLSEITFK